MIGGEYGAWITATGRVIPIDEMCAHQKFKPYEEADDEGWIAVINSHDVEYDGVTSIRFSDENVTVSALRKLLREILAYDGLRFLDFIIEGTYGTPTYFDSWGRDNTIDILTFLRNTIKNRLAGEDATEGKEEWGILK